MKYLSGLLTMVLMAGAAHAAGVYKWTDEKGRTHYSDKPVASAKRVEVNAPGVSQAPSAGAADADATKRAQKCTEAREKLQTYQNAEKIVEQDSLGKNREYSPAERRQLIARTEQQIADACTPVAPQANGAPAQKIEPQARSEAVPTPPKSPELVAPLPGSENGQ